MRRPFASVGLIFLVWTVLGVYTAHQLYYGHVGDQGMSWGYALTHQLSYSYFWGLQTPLVLWLSRRFPIRRRRWFATLLLHLTVGVLFSFPPRIFQQVWLSLAGYTPTLSLDPMTRFGSLGLIDYGVVFYWTILLFGLMQEYSEREHVGRLKASQLETELAKAQLETLRLQLNPHFLFNSLNTIVELIHENPQTAERLIIRLGELLRVCLSGSNVQEVPLSQEIDFVKQYVDIERTRFDERLNVTFALDPPTLDALVPSLILQPLVENAIKHGVPASEKSTQVLIESAFQNGSLRLRVADNGKGVAADSAVSNGTGLANTRSRLQRLYGSDHQFVARNQAVGGFECIVTIPRKIEE